MLLPLMIAMVAYMCPASFDRMSCKPAFGYRRLQEEAVINAWIDLPVLSDGKIHLSFAAALGGPTSPATTA